MSITQPTGQLFAALLARRAAHPDVAIGTNAVLKSGLLLSTPR